MNGVFFYLRSASGHSDNGLGRLVDMCECRRDGVCVDGGIWNIDGKCGWTMDDERWTMDDYGSVGYCVLNKYGNSMDISFCFMRFGLHWEETDMIDVMGEMRSGMAMAMAMAV